MSKLTAFLKGNVKEIKNVPLTLERFSEKIILRPLGAKEGDAIKDRSFVNKAGAKGKQERVFDPVKYTRELNIASIVHPDLNSTELQDSYGVKGSTDLYFEMFYLAETNIISEKVTDISDIDKDINDDIEEAKN